jgi:hypothetical protein
MDAVHHSMAIALEDGDPATANLDVSSMDERFLRALAIRLLGRDSYELVPSGNYDNFPFPSRSHEDQHADATYVTCGLVTRSASQVWLTRLTRRRNQRTHTHTHTRD